MLRLEFKAPKLPAWVWTDRLAFEVGTEAERGHGMDPPGASNTTAELRILENRILAKLQGLLHEEARRALPREEHSGPPVQALPGMLSARLLMGSCCEAFAALVCSRKTFPLGGMRGEKTVEGCRRIYEDSLHAAVWTSAHALFASNLQESGITAALPTVHSVPSELSEWEMGDLYARRVHTKSVFSKDCLAAISMLARCTNPGYRGWDSVVKAGIEKSDGLKRMAISAISVSATGMHSCIHPALRLHWAKRHSLIQFLSSTLTTNGLPALLSKMLAPFKEAMRRFTRNCISCEYATVAALARMHHPVALLKKSPLHMPHPGLEASCYAFLSAGEDLVLSGFNKNIASCVNAAFDECFSSEEHERTCWTPGCERRHTRASSRPRRARQCVHGCVFRPWAAKLSLTHSVCARPACKQVPRKGDAERSFARACSECGCRRFCRCLPLQLLPVLEPLQVKGPPGDQARRGSARRHPRHERRQQAYSASRRPPTNEAQSSRTCKPFCWDLDPQGGDGASWWQCTVWRRARLGNT